MAATKKFAGNAEKWKTADWSLTDSQISRQIGVSRQGVARARRRMQRQNSPHRRGKNVNWSLVDWGKSDSDISKKHNLRRATVAMARLRAKRPQKLQAARSINAAANVTVQNQRLARAGAGNAPGRDYLRV